MSFLIKTGLQRLVSPQFNKLQVSNYARWAGRRPLRVLDSEEHPEFQPRNKQDEIRDGARMNFRKEVTTVDMDELEHHEMKSQKKKYAKPKKEVPSMDMLETIIDASGKVVYTKMANNDPRVGTLLTTLKSKKEKAKQDLILLEGKRLIREALETGSKLKYLIFTRPEELDYLKKHLPNSGAQIYKMPYREMQMWSTLTTSPGIMGVFKTPEVDKFEAKNTIPLTVICDNVREPGNLGAILRTSAALGCKRVFLTKGCVNLWDSKVTRTAAGSHFRLQIHSKQDFQQISGKLSDATVKVFIADNNVVTGDGHEDLMNLVKGIPIVPYYSSNFSQTNENVLIVGGETEGISQGAYSLAAKTNGIRLNIPLENGVESLNTGTAFGIISFEIKRQFNTTTQKADIGKELDVSLGLRYL
ncbi:PREDICTED: rRNA methyltransferase 3, mitochondrial [Nicrophorus vespilloides]|uniref:rRNA methyltransferase 3, mitochondrial n=1 Tax=Nicrophorus vespilloides TaxID=110193 RepID=A0ABM1N1I2_NICVS|nr:PREDICTED: rRNA methyltransferase 3, mitochondrial [Nicrophorus vespilloides]